MKSVSMLVGLIILIILLLAAITLYAVLADKSEGILGILANLL